MLILRLFHGSFESNISEFYPLSHFGSKKQALNVLARKIVFDNKNINAAYLYEVEIEYNSLSNIIEVKDALTPRKQGLLLKYASVIYGEDEALKRLSDIRRDAEEHGMEIESEALKAINELALRNNHLIFSYKNKVEIDKVKNTSYCVIFPELIKKIEVTKINPEKLKKECKEFIEKYPGNFQEVLESLGI